MSPRNAPMAARRPGGGRPNQTDRGSHLPLDHHPLDLGDGLGRVETLRAGLSAVHDGVAAVKAERVLEIVEALPGRLVAAVLEPAVGLKQRGGSEETLAVPPIARRGRRASGGLRGSASTPSAASAKWSAATARSRHAGHRSW